MKLLDLDYKTRITAEQALAHPFLSSWHIGACQIC